LYYRTDYLVITIAKLAGAKVLVHFSFEGKASKKSEPVVPTQVSMQYRDIEEGVQNQNEGVISI
jgi:hypothetical protein